MASRMFRPARTEEKAQPLAWMTTFNDLMTLLMVFFVLLFAMGDLDPEKFKTFQNQLQSGLGVMHAGRNAGEGLPSESQGSVADKPGEPAETLPEAASSENFQELTRTQGLEAEYTPKGLRITLSDALLFQSGSASLTEQGLRLLGQISAVIKPTQRQVRIEGHTDDRPIATPRYPSNWELSAARAIGVVDYFINRGGIQASLLSAAGYGAFRPRASNDSEAQRAANRRVEIILGQVEASRPEN
ncbi:MAG: flagellar motor protein MotB [Desulfobacterales bacterium]|nr:flagellar motor protein MotB [Desulfobacterales bacterium]